MTIRPIRDQVLVKQDAVKEKLDSGIFLPQNSRDLYDDYATVIAVGPKVVDVKAGDRVLFKRRPASALEGEWKDYLMLKEEDMLAVIE